MSSVTTKEASRISLVFTDAGLRASVRADELGFKLKFTHIALGSATGYTPDRTETDLKVQKQIVPIQAGIVKEQEKQIQISTVFPGIDKGFWITEVGVFIEDPEDDQNHILALIWSESGKPLGYKSEGQELYLSFLASIMQADANNVVIQEANPDFGLLLKEQFDKFLPVLNIMASLETRQDEEAKKVVSASVSRSMHEDIARLKSAQNPVDFGEFPKYFAPLAGESIALKEHSTNQNGQWGFSGGKFFLFGKVYTLPSWEGKLTEVAYDLSTQRISSRQITDLISAIVLAGGEKLIFYIEIAYTNSSGTKSPSGFQIKTAKASEFAGESDPKTLPSSPIRIKLAELNKDTGNWYIRDSNLTRANLTERWQTLKVDGSVTQKLSFTPTSDYRVQIINPKRQHDYWIETQGSYVPKPEALERRIRAEWLGSEQMSIWLNASKDPEESFQLYLNRQDNWQARTMNPKDWTQMLGIGIGRIHSELVEPGDVGKLYPLSNICNGARMLIALREEYADYFAPKNDIGTRVLTALATRLGITLITSRGKKYITLPNFTNQPFMRWVLSGAGRYEADALQKHKHLDAGHTHTDSGHTHKSGFFYEYHSSALKSMDSVPAGYERTKRPSSERFKTSTVAHHDTVPGKAVIGNPVDSDTGESTPSFADETRPKNIGFLPLIKVR